MTVLLLELELLEEELELLELELLDELELLLELELDVLELLEDEELLVEVVPPPPIAEAELLALTNAPAAAAGGALATYVVTCTCWSRFWWSFHVTFIVTEVYGKPEPAGATVHARLKLEFVPSTLSEPDTISANRFSAAKLRRPSILS